VDVHETFKTHKERTIKTPKERIMFCAGDVSENLESFSRVGDDEKVEGWKAGRVEGWEG
jgi:hypothetical protein